MPHSGAADRLPHVPHQAVEAPRPGLADPSGAATRTEPAGTKPARAEPTPAESARAEAARTEHVSTQPGEADDAASGVVETWPATSRARLPVCVSYVDGRPDAPDRAPTS
jgi:hypothetical protein